jgi:antagonist of KipI
MDPLALRVANRLLGNDEGAPALEITGPGVEIRFAAAVIFAIAGADLGGEVRGRRLDPGGVFRARAGDVLAFRERRRGGRVMLAVSGGLDVPVALGSAATDLSGGLGGPVPGARLGRGARRAVRSAGPSTAAAPTTAAARATRGLAPDLTAAYDDPFLLGFVPDLQGGTDTQVRAMFAAAEFRVTDRSDRTGYRLAGPVLAVSSDPDRLSEPLAPGAIQLPPDGQPILLMADRNTTGGYARLGHLCAADRQKAAQLWPGDRVRFQASTAAEARAALARLEAAVEMVRPVAPDE